MTEPVERGRRSRPTLARRALRVAKALGLTVADVSPGMVVLARRGDVQVQQVPGGAVVGRPGRARVLELGHGVAVVAARSDLQVRQVRGGAVGGPRGGQVDRLGEGAALLMAAGGLGLADRQTEKDLYGHLPSRHLAQILDLYGVN